MRRVRAAAQDRFAAERLVAAAAGLVRDVTRMQAKAESQRKRLLTFTIETEVGFAEPADVARFSQALVDAVARLSARFQAKGAERRYRVVIGGHPAPKVSRPAERSRLMKPPRALVVELVVAAPIDVVWNALTDRAAIAQWFGWNHADLPAEVEFIFFDADAKADEATHRLTIGDDEFALEPRGDQTVLRVTRAAPASGNWEDIYDEITEGWRTFAYQLQYRLNHHPAETRRTMYLSGRTRTEGAPPPAGSIGSWLARQRRGWPGVRHQQRSGRAIRPRLVPIRVADGLVVDAFGPGLLVGMRRPATDKSPFGGGMFVLTLYGFDEAAHDALTQRWRAWFESHFDNVTVQT